MPQQLPVGRGIHPRSVSSVGTRGVATQLLSSATLWLDARNSVAGEQIAVNKGTGGSALDARYGSALGAYIKGGAVVLPGTAGNYLSVPDAAPLDITGDIEIVARIVPPAIGTQRTIIAKEQSTTTRSFRFGLTSSGLLAATFSTDGSVVA